MSQRNVVNEQSYDAMRCSSCNLSETQLCWGNLPWHKATVLKLDKGRFVSITTHATKVQSIRSAASIKFAYLNLEVCIQWHKVPFTASGEEALDGYACQGPLDHASHHSL